MKVLMKPIQVYALYRENGSMLPMAFCLEEDGEKVKIAILAVNGSHEERQAGRKVIYFDCRVGNDVTERIVCLRYDIADHCWFLYKA
ncbi:MAG: hypothetical protein IKV45_03005 [Firmicutes bacterium]|nr:hypothetical protein [Bacillota bacterium]